MCTLYDPLYDPPEFGDRYNVAAPDLLGMKRPVYRKYIAPIVFLEGKGTADEKRVARMGHFGLIPNRASPDEVKTWKAMTVNARTESAAKLYSFAPSIKAAQFCVIPANHIVEPYYATPESKNVWHAIGRADRQTMSVGGIWARWEREGHDPFYSFAMLTVNADSHPFLKQFHKWGEEKRSVVMLEDDEIEPWLCADKDSMHTFFKAHEPEQLLTWPVSQSRPSA